MSDWWTGFLNPVRRKGVNAEISFGDSVRIRVTPFTESLGYAGRTGTCYGFTTPSVTDVEVVGGLAADFAFRVEFEEEDVEDAWFTPELVEYLNHAAGTTASIGGHHFIRTEDGQWVPVEDEPPVES
jgi:hypothetical protein